MCEFCKLKESKSRVILENDFVFVMPTNIPIVPGHLLICPTRHIEKFDELSEKELSEILETIKKLKSILKVVFKATGFNLAWNEGKSAGQSIPHLHIHLLPRKEGDEGITEYEPRKFLYRPGSRQTSPDSELEEVCKMIKEKL